MIRRRSIDFNLVLGGIWHSNGMGGDGAFDSRMSDMLKNFDLNSTEVKQQFGMLARQNMYSVCYSIALS